MIRLATLAVLLGVLASPLSLAQSASRNAVREALIGANERAAADDPVWSWSPAPRWLGGVNFGLSSFEGGLDYGYNFFGSSVDASGVFPVDLVFDPSTSSAVRVFRRDLGYADDGVGTIRAAAYDMTNPSAPRRLNMAIVEDNRIKTADGVWNPTSAGDGAREYVFIFSSSYDGDGSTYAGANIFTNPLDVVIALAPRVLAGASLFQTSPATLSLSVPPLRAVSMTATANGTLDVTWAAGAFSGATTVRLIDATGGGTTLLREVTSSSGSTQLTGLDPSQTYAIRLDLVDDAGNVIASETRTKRPATHLRIEAATHLNPNRAGGSTYGDVWGYTASDGTEYALLAGRGAGLSILDITDAPASPPVEVSFVPIDASSSDSKDVKVYDHYAYLVNETGPIQIIDIEDPTSPSQVGTLNTQPGIGGGGAHNVAVFNGHLWVTGGRQSGNAGVRVYDARTTPEAPVFVGEFKPNHFASPYYHDFEVKGGYGFGPGIYGDGMDILDVTDPANITRVSTFNYPGGSGAHNTCASEDGTTLYVGDEIGSAGNWTRIFDIADPQNVELVDSIIIDDQAVVHNCYTKGDLLYIAHYTEGLHIFDVRDPQAPVQVAFYDTYLQPGYGFRGAWSVYPYFESGKVVVSDMQSGLFVVMPEASLVADESAPHTATATLSVAPNPARGQATFTLQLEAPAPVRLSVFDVRGRELRVLLDEPVGMDRQRVDLDTSTLAPGAYVVRLVVEGQAPISQMLTVVR